MAPGVIIPSYDGNSVRARQTRLADAAGRTAPALLADVDAAVRWHGRSVSRDRAGVLAGGLVDLALKWPLDRELTVAIDGEAQSNTISVDTIAPYELGALLGGPPPLPTATLQIDESVLKRIDLLASAAFAAPVALLDPMVEVFAQVSDAVTGRRPMNRLTALWSALRVARPLPKSDLAFIRGFVNGRAFVRDERWRTNAWRLLYANRAIVRRDRWFHENVRSALQGRTRSIEGQMRMATVFAYAFRSAIAHGHWSATEDRRVFALVCEQWLWVLVERVIELSLLGRRLGAAPDVTSVSVSR